jgi:hypothetical protein
VPGGGVVMKGTGEDEKEVEMLPGKPKGLGGGRAYEGDGGMERGASTCR